jgi:beta-lactamase class A
VSPRATLHPEQATVERAVAAFAGADPGRSVAVVALAGPPLEVAVRADEPRPGASLLKLPLVGAVYDAAAAGVLDLDARVPRDRLPVTAYRSVLAALDPGRELSVAELCSFALAASDNTAAHHLLGLVGAEGVNATARAWGCTATRLEAGFDDAALDASARRNVTTARDALRMVATLGRDPAYARAAPALANAVGGMRIRLRLPPGTRVLSKTGSLEGVCHDAGLILAERSELGLAFLCEGQRDTALCGVAIGDAVAAAWAGLGLG